MTPFSRSARFHCQCLQCEGTQGRIVCGGRIAAGIVGGLLAAVFGLIDWFAIPNGTRAKRIGLLHGGANVVVVVIFAVVWLMRSDSADSLPSTNLFLLEVVALGLGSVAGWLGGELVDRLGVGVDDGAHLDGALASFLECGHSP